MSDDVLRMNPEYRASLMMAACLASALIIALVILLVNHLYFTWTSMSSVESGGLMDFNPFFEPNSS